MSKLFSDESILARANVRWMVPADQAFVQGAMQLLRDQFSCYRIIVKPEAISLTDYAALKQERTEIIQGIAYSVPKTERGSRPLYRAHARSCRRD